MKRGLLVALLVPPGAPQAFAGLFAAERDLNGHPVEGQHNQVRGNVLVDCGWLVYLSAPDNASDYNVVGDVLNPEVLAAWQALSGEDAHSLQLPIEVSRSYLTLSLKGQAPEALDPASEEPPGPFAAAALEGDSFLLYNLACT